ncbi:MAG: ATP synthase F0 subunit B [Myxococcales bacterium]|nr:ATP synthase F0 subunit B [Myxococcales bacterium]MCB9731310.1 ATP synthase F0 subunit B [Deltaproteobacteria bacterium]
MKRLLQIATVALGALAPAVALAAEGGHHEAGFGMIELWYVVDFLIFAFVLWYVLFKKGTVQRFLLARHNAAKAEMEEATRLKAEAEAKLAEYARLRAGLDAEIAAIREQFRVDGERERERILADAKAQAERLRVTAEKQLQQETAKLREELEHEVVKAVLEATEAQVKAQMGGTAQRQLFNSYIKDLESLDSLGRFAA